MVIPEKASESLRNAIQEVLRVHGKEGMGALKKAFEQKGYAVTNQLEEGQKPEIPVFIRREAKFIHESNLIEDVDGIAFETILHAIAQRENGGHAEAWNFAKRLAEEKVALTPQHVCLMQSLIINEQSQFPEHFLKEDQRGRIRKKGEFVSIGGNTKPPISEDRFQKFFSNLTSQLQKLRSNDVDAIIKLAAQTHMEYEEGLHPFNDGNGRTGRLIINYIFAFHGLPPLVIVADKRESYYEAFGNGDENSWEKMNDFFQKTYEENKQTDWSQ